MALDTGLADGNERMSISRSIDVDWEKQSPFPGLDLQAHFTCLDTLKCPVSSVRYNNKRPSAGHPQLGLTIGLYTGHIK